MRKFFYLILLAAAPSLCLGQSKEHETLVGTFNVRFLDGEARVYGSPWSGKTPCYRNEDYPIGAFVRINRAPYNAIHRQNVTESFASISSSSSGLRAIRSIGDGLFTTISSLIQSIPCFVLDCLPDDDAACVCSNEVLKNG